MDYKGKKVLVLDGFGRQQASILRQLHDLGCIITTVNDCKLDVVHVLSSQKRSR